MMNQSASPAADMPRVTGRSRPRRAPTSQSVLDVTAFLTRRGPCHRACAASRRGTTARSVALKTGPESSFPFAADSSARPHRTARSRALARDLGQFQSPTSTTTAAVSSIPPITRCLRSAAGDPYLGRRRHHAIIVPATPARCIQPRIARLLHCVAPRAIHRPRVRAAFLRLGVRADRRAIWSMSVPISDRPWNCWRRPVTIHTTLDRDAASIRPLFPAASPSGSLPVCMLTSPSAFAES